MPGVHMLEEGVPGIPILEGDVLIIICITGGDMPSLC